MISRSTWRLVAAAAAAVLVCAGSATAKPLDSMLGALDSPKPAARDQAWQTLTKLLNDRELRPADIAPRSARVARLLALSIDRVVPFQRIERATCDSFAADDDYAVPRNEAELLLDLAALAQPEAVAPALQRALKLEDRRLRYFAAMALLKNGGVVDRRLVEDIAADDDIRNDVYRGLVATGHEALFPPALRTQEAFARSELVHWLTYPTELGCVPDEIRLLKKVAIGEHDAFVFAFRVRKPHAAHMRGWLAGVAGPYLRRDEPTTTSEGGTFSDFVKADSKPPEEHAARMHDLLEQTAKLRFGAGAK
jgi:hypothetical protein